MKYNTPFNQIYHAFWDGFERNTSLTNLVLPDNRIKFNDSLGTKEQINEGDLPEVMLMQVGGQAAPMNTSGTSHCKRNYIWFISTGDFNNELINEIEWQLFRAMIDWDVFLCPLTWPDDNWHYIEKVDTVGIEEGTAVSSLIRNIKGWTASLNMEVSCNFRTTDLRIS